MNGSNEWIYLCIHETPEVPEATLREVYKNTVKIIL